jgi:uncharacterized membrane protein YkoI
MRRLLGLILLAGTLLHPVAVLRAADHDREHDQERARRALEAGEILPLDQILEAVRQRYAGSVIELELQEEGRRWVYEVELLADDGRLLRLRIDARTRQLLEAGDD